MQLWSVSNLIESNCYFYIQKDDKSGEVEDAATYSSLFFFLEKKVHLCLNGSK